MDFKTKPLIDHIKQVNPEADSLWDAVQKSVIKRNEKISENRELQQDKTDLGLKIVIDDDPSSF